MTKILVVDDMPIFRDPIAASLRLAGFETVCASNGQEALVAVKAHRPAVVLLDVSMPVMDGLTCLRAMRADPDVAKTPVILFTALSDKKYVLEAGKLGVHDYLLKSSFSLKELLARVIKYTGVPPRPASSAPAGKRVHIAPATAPAGAETAPTPASGPVVTTATGSSQGVPRLLTREQCVARAEKALSAKTLSGAVAEVISLAASPRGNVSDLAPLIARDPLLSARVLQAANSAAYVSSRPVVSTIPDAVRQIGMSTVRSIAAALGIFDAMPASSADGFNPIRCWQHSFAVAMLCERLCPEPKGGKDAGGDSGLAYLIGLCHDLGEVLFHTQFAKEYGQVLEAKQRTGRPRDELEREMMGMTRGELVQTIIQRMGLPDAIREPIRCFHEGAAATGSSGGAMTRLLRVAENYANGLLLASSGRSTVAPLTRAECKATLGREEPKVPDTTHFRSEVFYTTGVLARLSEEEARAVMTAPFERSKARVCVVREASLAPLDPVTAALEAMAHVKVVDRISAVDRDSDGVVVLAPSDLSAGFPVEDMSRAAPNVLWLVGRVNGMAQRNAPVSPQRWPVRLDDLVAFALRCAGGGSAAAA
jgi:HD-like signal output (HDOD) protein/ActR/RegA family two-component response regulator